MIEIWKDIKNLEGLYQVSNNGKIRSLDRIITYIDGRKYHYKGKILKQYIQDNGYYYILLNYKRKLYRFSISRLVLSTFVRHPKNGEEAAHFPDSDKSKNNVDNLIWCSPKENSSHKVTHKTLMMGNKHWNAKLSEKEVIEIRYLSKTKTQSDISQIYNISRRTISDIIKKKTWRHINE